MLINTDKLINVTVEDARGAGMTDAEIDSYVTAQIVREAHAQIDAICDRLYTTSPSRNARYNNKYNEALAYVAAGYPASVAEADYPTLVAEAPARGLTKRQLADLVIAKRDAFNALGGAAEAARASIEAAVTAADGIDAKRAAAAAIVNAFAASAAAAG